MPLLAFLLPVICLGLCLVPVWLLRRSGYARAHDYFVSSEHTPSGVIQNSSIAHALQLTVLGPLFVWGASGDFRPPMIGAVCFGLGLYLMYLLRRPMLAFLDDALSHDRSITLHDFIARQHGNDPRVRLLASSLTVIACCGLAVGQAFAVAMLLRPVLTEGIATYAVVGSMLILMGLYTIPSGHSGVMRSTQLQLGMIYLGLIGSTALLLYQLISDRRPVPPYGTFAIVVAVVCCVILVCYRRSRYVDTSPLGNVSAHADDGTESVTHEPSGARLFVRFEKILNVCISIVAVLVVVVAVIGLSAEGWSAIARDIAVALQNGTGVPGMGLLSLLLLPLLYPIVDLTNWQRLAAFESDKALARLAPAVRAGALRRLFRIYAVESVLMFVFMCMFGTIAALATAIPGGADVMQAFVRGLAVEQNPLAAVAFSLLLTGLAAIALSTMSSLFSASLCAIRYDILPSFFTEPVSGTTHDGQEAGTIRRAILAGVGLCIVMAAMYFIADEFFHLPFPNGLVAVWVAFLCAQLALVPLVLAPLIGRTGGRFGAVNARSALGIIASGAGAGIGAVAVHLATGSEWWLWAAVPACLGTGLLLFAVARLRSGGMPDAA